MIRKDVCESWIAALRSGRYLQGHHQLRSGDRFSALGVLADVLCQPDWDDPLPGEWSIHDKHGDVWVYYGPQHRVQRTGTTIDGESRLYEYRDPKLEHPPFYVVGLPRDGWWGLSWEDQHFVHDLNDRWFCDFRTTATQIEQSLLLRQWYHDQPVEAAT